ncbi:uncharacterized protein LOC121979764 [Zingiber officinale]|uniref:uncharacterized protein LOC121979764 n=1 Tax=Zingiber officinale TaxID=94328 RepID=UPI001C4D0C84|nr:uncharacterized protein LOC121979764 [Zingiber officinale]
MVLRIADNETRPAMGYIYEAMDRANETILKSFDNNREKCKNVLDIIDSRWDRQLHHPLHAAGYYLNSYFYYHNPKVETDTEVTNGLFACIQRLIPSPELRDKIIMEELPVYKNSESLFGNEFAIRARNNKDQPMTPANWWKMFGNGTPNLKEFAIKVLSLTCSASGCERNWSIFEHFAYSKSMMVPSYVAQLHSKKRNRLDHKKLHDLVYVKYNQTLKACAVKKDKGDPIVLRNIDDCNNEWLTGMMEAGEEPIFDDDDDTLTWNVVAEAIGVEEVIRHTRQQQTLNPIYRGASTSTSRGKESTNEGEFDDDVLKDYYSDIDENVEDGDGDEMIELEND